MNQCRVGVAAIIVRDGKMLFHQRGPKAPGAGTWSLPGGNVEFCEDPVDAVRREIFEECGLLVGRVVLHRTHPYANTIFPATADRDTKHYVTLYFHAEYVEGEAVVKEPEKCLRWEWTNGIPAELFVPSTYTVATNSRCMFGCPNYVGYWDPSPLYPAPVYCSKDCASRLSED